MSLLKNFKHSASSANKFVNVPQLFVADKIMGIKQPYGDAAIRGNVAEPLARYLMAKDVTGEQALDFATKKWEKLGGQDKTELRFAYDCAYLIAEELQSRQLKRPEKYQERVFNDGKEFGLKYGIHGFLDFSYFKNVPMPLVIDIKTTKRVPSSLETCSYDHILQQSLYWKLSGQNRKFALLYVSNKKTNYLEIPEAELRKGWEIIYYNMKLIERFDDICKSKADWIKMFPYPDLSSFYFSDKKFKQKITELYEELI
tara:strand:- start:1741 stop:2511 length:771 start_codon:yes stop_codon:yes gene_type:complete